MISHNVEQEGRDGDAPVAGAALLGKACDVLEAVAASPGGMGQGELATRLGLPRTTVYRILAALTARGLLRQDPSRRVYALGFRLLEMVQGPGLAASDPAAPDLAAVAAPELRALRDATGETAYIAVLEGHEVLSFGKFEGAHEQRSAARLGQRKPLHCTSLGKAMLAFLPEREQAALLRRLPLPGLTPNTLTDRRRLTAALRIIRARGFAIDDEEILPGVRCVGAPILDGQGRMRGALSVAGPAFRMTRERLELLGPELAAAGRRVGASLRAPAGMPAGPASALPGAPAFRGMAPRPCGRLLWWADALAPELRLQAEAAEPRAVRWEAPILGLTALAGGDALLADVRGVLARVTASGGVVARPAQPDLAMLRVLRTRPNGEIWGCLWDPAAGASRIGRLSAAGRFDLVWSLPGEVAAIAWSADAATLHAATPSTGTIHRLEAGRATPLVLTRLPPGGGRPVGLAADREGCLWVALCEGWSILRLTPDGDVDRVLPLPVPHPTDIAFGGAGERTLFVTTSRHGLALEALASAPLSGRVLVADAGVAGAPEAPAGA